MKREEALTAIQSSNMHERLKGARYLKNIARPGDYDAVTAAFAIESVVWVRSALHEVLERIGAASAERAISSRVWEDVEPEDEAYARAVEDTTRRLVHEIEPIVGMLRRHARREVSEFEKSSTARSLSRLDDTLTALSVLGKAAAVPRMLEFDLSDLIHSVGESEALERGVRTEFAGITPLLSIGDPTIVSIVIANAVRNAAEATAAGNRNDSPVIVNWGSTATEYWIAVLDSGIGLPLSAGKVYEIGATTKPDHLGMGLAVCYRAAKTLGGRITLSRRDEVGVSFEFRWPHPYTVKKP
jgi:signal transduction histidine kinase